MRPTSSPPVAIGALQFDAGRRQLVGAAGTVELPLKEFELLSLLVARRPHVVSKDEIRDALWPDTIVTDASLTSLVKELREKLGQAGRKGPIRTVHGFGYALADVEETRSGPRARLVRGTAEIVVTAPGIVLGREPGLPGTIEADSVSRRHARVDWDGRTASVSDLGSKNGTFVNGVRVADGAPLEDGDEVRFGLVTFTYRTPGTGGSTTKTVA